MEALGYHKSSIQRFVSTLEDEGAQSGASPTGGGYRLGLQVLFLGSIADLGTD